jgi:hypothetical protein
MLEHDSTLICSQSYLALVSGNTLALRHHIDLEQEVKTIELQQVRSAPAIAFNKDETRCAIYAGLDDFGNRVDTLELVNLEEDQSYVYEFGFNNLSP